MVLIEGARWSLMLVWLSLDGIRPLFEPMGLVVPGGFVPTLRQAILRHARPDPSRPSMFVPDTLQTLADTFGDEPVGSLVEWARFVFTYDDTEHLDLRRWQAAMETMAGDEEAWGSLGLPEHLREPARGRLLAQVECEAIEDCLDQLAGDPLSDWDVCIHVARGFEPDDGDPAANDPARFARDTAQTRRRRDYWAWLLGGLDERGREGLYQAVRSASGDDTLRHPRVLVRHHGRP